MGGKCMDENEKRELIGLRKFYIYMMNMYGHGHEVTNWHQNGELESLDNFLDSAEQEFREAR
jgi:hypothetical protein